MTAVRPALDELIADLDKIDPADIDAYHAAFARMVQLYPDSRDEIRQRLQAREDQARDALDHARREAERAEAEAAHMHKWAAAERAKGRPEAELIWGNCIAETGVLGHKPPREVRERPGRP